MEALHRYHIAGETGFKASNGWLCKWMLRHGMSTRQKTTVAQKLPEDLEDKVLGFQRYVIRMRKIREYTLGQIGNMDETAVYYDMAGSHTLHTKGSRTVLVKTTGHEKDKLTVALAAMADGKKLPPLVILKGVRPPKSEDIPSGIRVFMTSNGWINEQACKFWISKIWKQSSEGRKLLVWDSFRAHKTPQVKNLVSCKEGGNSDVAMIPGGCTGILQPADLSWNKPFKSRICELWDNWFNSGEHTFTKGGAMRKPTAKLMLEWINTAWKELDEELIIKSFKKPGISCNMDGSEDHIDWDSDDEDGEINFPGYTQQEVADAEAITAAANDELQAMGAVNDDVEEEEADDEQGEYYYDSDDGNKTE
jgi:hypothetical protein